MCTPPLPPAQAAVLDHGRHPPVESSGDLPCDLGKPRERSPKTLDPEDLNGRAFWLVRCIGLFLFNSPSRTNDLMTALLVSDTVTTNGAAVTKALDLCRTTGFYHAKFA